MSFYFGMQKRIFVVSIKLNIKTIKTMARPTKEFKLITLTFRVDPLLMETFHKHCNDLHTTRSEAFREIFNGHINQTLIKNNEDNIIQLQAD